MGTGNQNAPQGCNGKTASNENHVDDQYAKYQNMYTELCLSYRAIDDFRAKLLGFLPLATGTGIFILFSDKANLAKFESYLPLVGAFGILVTFGLFVYELFGIKKCGELILLGTALEKHLHCPGHGQFSVRPDRVKDPKKIKLIEWNEPVAAGIIYPAVLAAYTYLLLFPCLHRNGPLFVSSVAASVFIIGFAFTLEYDYILRKKSTQRTP